MHLLHLLNIISSNRFISLFREYASQVTFPKIFRVSLKQGKVNPNFRV